MYSLITHGWTLQTGYYIYYTLYNILDNTNVVEDDGGPCAACWGVRMLFASTSRKLWTDGSKARAGSGRIFLYLTLK